MSLYFGLDIGGTGLKAAIVAEDGSLLAQTSTPTAADRRTAEEILACSLSLFYQLEKQLGLERDHLAAVGVGSPGLIDRERRTIIRATNLPFDRVDVRGFFESRLGLPVFVGNDANVAALAESRIGAGRGADSVVLVTLGTGVGGGIVLGQRVWAGFNGAGCELGHVVIALDGVPCSCGRLGCFESYASATALIRQTREAAKRHPDSQLGRYVREGGIVEGRTAFALASQGDPVSQNLIACYERYVGIGLANIINSLMPERILLGGGISKAGSGFLANVERVALSEAFLHPAIKAPSFHLASLGNDAGMVGAALYARDILADRQT